MYYINLKTPEHGVQTVAYSESYKSAKEALQKWCSVFPDMHFCVDTQGDRDA